MTHTADDMHASPVTPAESEAERLRRALEALVDRLDLVHADPQFQSVWTIAQLHGQPYGGLTYTNALEAARTALASPFPTVTPAPVGEVLTEEMIDAGAEAYHIAADAAITKAKAKNAAYENAGRLITVPEVAFPKDWLAPVYLAMRRAAPPSDTSGEAVAQQWIPVDYAEAHPWGERFSASALAATEARGVDGATAVIREARGLVAELENKRGAHEGVDLTWVWKAHARLETALRSLSPAHKGSEND